jgi:hypothetical protein
VALDHTVRAFTSKLDASGASLRSAPATCRLDGVGQPCATLRWDVIPLKADFMPLQRHFVQSLCQESRFGGL